MPAKYEISIQRTRQSDPHPGGSFDMLEAAREIAARHAPNACMVTIRDGFMVMARWIDSVPETIRPEVLGHPEGCSGGECAIYAEHLTGFHRDHVCEHQQCRRCTGCGECDWREQDERTRKAIAGRLSGAADDIEQALASANSAHVAFIELTTSDHLFDVDLAETSAGDDAVAKLLRAMEYLRDAARITELRRLREAARDEVG